MTASAAGTRPANAFLVYLAPRERVWWLQMSFSATERANRVCPNSLAGSEGPFRGGERGPRETRKEKGKEEKNGRDRRKHRNKENSGYGLGSFKIM